MDAHRVHVLHGADSDGVAHAVPDDLELDLLPAGDALFNQDLGNGRQTQTILSDLMEFFHGGGNTAAGTAHGEGRTDDDRQADLLGEGDGIGQIFHNLGGDTGLTDLLHGVLEHLAVLRLVDGGALGAQQTHIVLRQESILIQLHRQGQAGLSAQGGEQAIGLFNFNYALDHIQGQRFDIDLVCHGLIGHDGSRVGVDQYHFQSLFLEGPAGLGTGIVKFGSLTDDDRTRADYHYFLQIISQRHCTQFLPVDISSINRRYTAPLSRPPTTLSGLYCTEKAGIPS